MGKEKEEGAGSQEKDFFLRMGALTPRSEKRVKLKANFKLLEGRLSKKLLGARR